ncbi:outer dynein arm-docking complex subunit 4-like [Amia ocellicauda]|uniref:outer dynein arm-docking complex subunit 4-like n=1 Tax=Amia ocellicauda TaxID=2972642 RepID=UPI0034638B57
MGNFEFALVFFHRGHKLRPELQELRLGIQKAQEAIENSVGSPSSVKLENIGDLSFFHGKDEGKKEQELQSKKESPKSKKTERELLGELFTDKEYLEKLLEDKDLISRNGNKVDDLILSGINYLDTRIEFWRQHKPIYAWKRGHK